MKYHFQVENIRCGGCNNTITSKLLEIDGVQDVMVNVDEQQVTVITDSTINTNIKEILSNTLMKLGYPETGSAESDRLLTKATSFVSCALGKVSGKS